ncbi:MAG: protein kinase [Acidobacteriota bacterium]
MATIGPSTALCGIVLHPAGHTRSPAMHNAAFRALGLDAVYLAFDVPPDSLPEAISGVRALGIRQVAVSIPHKEAVIEHLDEVDDTARAIGAVNTVTRVGDRLVGSNTDYLGALRALEREREDLEQRRDDRPDPHLDELLRVLDLRRATILEHSDRFFEAAKLHQEHGEIAEAGRLFELAGANDRAAEAYLRIDHHADALRVAEGSEVIEPELHAEILLQAEQPQKAAELFAEIGHHEKAAIAYEGAVMPAEAAEQWRAEHRYSKAARRFQEAGRHYDAAQCWALADDDIRAGENFERAGAPGNAADAFASAGDNLRAGRLYLDASQDDDARRVLAEIRPGEPQYFEAAFELVPLLLDVGDGPAAGQQLKAIIESGRRFPAHQINYCHGRIFEFRRRYDEAESAYQRVLTEHPEYRDTQARLTDIRSRVTDPTLVEDDDGPGTGITQVLRADVHSTQRMLKASSADTGSMPDHISALETFQPEAGWEELSGAIATLDNPEILEESSELPVELGERLEHAWWDGADFFSVRDKETHDSLYMVSFPLAFVGDRIPGFQSAIRQVSALQQRAILQLEGMQLASDKVLLFYETFDGVPLSAMLQKDRTFPPREALHLLVQLCDALSSAHKLGVTHQWLSPKTILIDQKNRCKIVGLGLREFLAGQDNTSLAYQSPEVQNDGVIGPTCDVFSLGLLAMELLHVGLPPRPSLDPDDYTWSQEVRDEVPGPLRNFLVRCLEPDPLLRPSTAETAASLASVGLVSGQVLGDRYEVQGEIGRGGMSRVYRAYDTNLEADVAIKTVLTAALGRSEDEERLVREVKISLKISHPNVVRVHDMGRFPGGIFMIMELLDGPGLDRVIADEAPLALDRVRRLVIEIASALGEAHRLKIVHRDLKPGNVILVEDRAKVLDFGIARSVDGSSPHLTRTGEVIGSPLYMSPEQVQGKELDGTSDLYSLGVITFALLTGKEPFAADNATEVVLKHLHDPPPDAGRLRPGGLQQPWLDLLDRLLRKNPSERPPTAEALIRELEALPT